EREREREKNKKAARKPTHTHETSSVTYPPIPPPFPPFIVVHTTLCGPPRLFILFFLLLSLLDSACSFPSALSHVFFFPPPPASLALSLPLRPVGPYLLPEYNHPVPLHSIIAHAPHIHHHHPPITALSTALPPLQPPDSFLLPSSTPLRHCSPAPKRALTLFTIHGGKTPFLSLQPGDGVPFNSIHICLLSRPFALLQAVFFFSYHTPWHHERLRTATKPICKSPTHTPLTDSQHSTLDIPHRSHSNQQLNAANMDNEHQAQHSEQSHLPPHIERSQSSSSSSSVDHEHDEHQIHQPTPIRPRLPSRKSSGPLVVPRDSSAVGPIDAEFGPDDVRAMSPRRTSEDIEALGREAREELKRHAKALQDSLLTIFNRIEAVREEHDKLDNNNKFLQKYIGDLMTTSKITAAPSKGKK
ncbi:bzip transcription factor, partial [Colletotrichum incanum]